MAASYLAGWLALGRALTERSATAAGWIGLAAAISCAAACFACRALRRAPWTARFAAAFVLLVCGTAAWSAVFFAVTTAFAHHPLGELPLRIVLLILAILGAGSLYGFLSIAAWLMLPLGLPFILVAAALAARAR